jgi:hypothetical protein
MRATDELGSSAIDDHTGSQAGDRALDKRAGQLYASPRRYSAVRLLSMTTKTDTEYMGIVA